MQKLIILIVAFFFVRNLQSQCDPSNSQNTISTDWKYFDKSSKYPNQWNWTLPDNRYWFYLHDNMDEDDNRRINVELPYFCTRKLGTGGCENRNLIRYHLLGNDNQDIYPEDGWELIGMDFGSPNSSSNSNDGKGTDYPFFIIYNKYNGKLKIYTAIIGRHDVNKAMITTLFSDNTKLRTALLAHAKPIAQPLMTFEPMNKISTLNSIEIRIHEDDYYWLASEIQTAYDPCTCNGINKNSLLEFLTETITTSTITATIEGSSTQVLADKNTVKSDDNKNTSFFNLAIDAYNSGLESYNQWDGYKSKINSNFDKFNENYKNKLIDDWFQENVEQTYGKLYTSDYKKQLFDDFKSSDDNFKKMVGVNKIDKYNKYNSTVKGIASTLPYVGTIIGVTEFFIGLSKKNKNKKETKETPPITYQSSFKLNGKIETYYEITNRELYNPGHPIQGGGVDVFKPFYNNPLGIFHILKSPLVEYHELEKEVHYQRRRDYNGGTIDYTPIDDDVTEIAKKTNYIRQWQLKEDVKYVVNPASNLEVEMIDACYVLEYKKSENLYITPHEGIDQITPIPFGNKYYKTLSLNERIEDIEESSNLKLEYVTADYPNGEQSYIRFRTPYTPLQCLKNMNFVTIGQNGGNMRVYIKMLIRFKFKNTENYVTQIVMYDISNSFKNDKIIKNENTGKCKIFLYPKEFGFFAPNKTFYKGKDFYFSKVEFSFPSPNFYFIPSHIDYFTGMKSSNSKSSITIKANQHIGDNVTLLALDEINIEEGVTFGNNVTLKAGKKINVPYSVEITANTVLEIIDEPILFANNCSNSDISSLHATKNEIVSICTSKEYMDRAQAKPEANNNGSYKQNLNLEFELYPNPNKGSFFVSITEVPNDCELQIMDAVGRKVFTQKIQNYQNQLYIDTELQSGIYYIKLKTTNDSIIKKMIINK
jgi:hypothetical protein